MRIETPKLSSGAAAKKIKSLLQHNFNTPVTVRDMSDRLNLTRATARRRCSEMVKAGVLTHHDTTMDVQTNKPVFTYKLVL